MDRELDELELDPEDVVSPPELELDELEPEDPDDELDDEPPLRGTACWADAHAGVATVRPKTKTAMRVDLGMVGSRSPLGLLRRLKLQLYCQPPRHVNAII